jgi:class 3 adenylate cyclase
MPSWTSAYESELREFFRELTASLPARLRQVVTGRTTPALEALTIGSAREVAATVLFFDIEGSTSRTPTGRPEHLRTTLATLNCVIPMISRVVTDHSGYIEKNTGDGLMAIFGPSDSSANDALDAATTCFYVLREVVNPFLTMNGIAPVDARIGIDHGQILLARIGLPTGGADNQRNFLTAIGPAANIAFRLQGVAGTNGICVGDGVRQRASPARADHFQAFIPPGWSWVIEGTQQPYWVWKYIEQRTRPFNFAGLLALLGRPESR